MRLREAWRDLTSRILEGAFQLLHGYRSLGQRRRRRRGLFSVTEKQVQDGLVVWKIQMKGGWVTWNGLFNRIRFFMKAEIHGERSSETYHIYFFACCVWRLISRFSFHTKYFCFRLDLVFEGLGLIFTGESELAPPTDCRATYEFTTTESDASS